MPIVEGIPLAFLLSCQAFAGSFARRSWTLREYFEQDLLIPLGKLYASSAMSDQFTTDQDKDMLRHPWSSLFYILTFLVGQRSIQVSTEINRICETASVCSSILPFYDTNHSIIVVL